MKLLKSLSMMVLLAASAAQAAPILTPNLLVNGSFEDNRVANNSWTWFAASQVNGWDGSNLEFWNNFSGVKAFDGSNFLELNAHGENFGDWSVAQQFATIAGARYEVSFAYRNRTGRDESFKLAVGNLAQTFTHRNSGSWTVFSGWFTAGSSNSVLQFTSLNGGTLGNFIDDVRVSRAAVPATNQVSAASSLSLLMMAAGLLLWRRRRNA
jgi:hypothetical protein